MKATTNRYNKLIRQTNMPKYAIAECAEIFPSEFSRWSRDPSLLTKEKRIRVQRAVLLIADLIQVLSEFPSVTLNFKDASSLRILVATHWKNLQQQFKNTNVSDVLG